MTRESRQFIPPTREEIARYAFHLWESEGRQPGRDLDYWLQAETHLTVDRKYEAGLLAQKDGQHKPEQGEGRPCGQDSSVVPPPKKARPTVQKLANRLL